MLVEAGASAGPVNPFSTHLLEEGWRGLLLEQDAAVFSHLKDRWKIHSGVQCILQGSQPLTDLLLNAETPADFGVLILNRSGEIVSALLDLESSVFRPKVIALQDEGEGAELRSSRYSILVKLGYLFAGAEQTFSLWSLSAGEIEPDQGVRLAKLPGMLDERLGITCFDTPTSEASYAAAGHLDLEVGGWAFLEESQSVPPLVYIEMTDLRTGEVSYSPASRYPRMDVALHFGNSNLLMSGFQGVVSMRHPHSNGLRLRVIQSQGEKHYLSPSELRIERGLKEYEQTARQGLAQKFLRGSGVEIGALQRKLELPASCKVRYVDRMGMADLLHHYPELRGMPLQSPDIVDDGERLETLMAGALDFVIANHFFEHSENPVQTLVNLFRVLKPQGILFMAVPDKRYTFDSSRPSTSFESLKRTYQSGERSDKRALYDEWVEFVERNESDKRAERADELYKTKYSIHFNVWTADELLVFLIRVRHELGIRFHISSAVCSDNETILLLEKLA